MLFLLRKHLEFIVTVFLPFLLVTADTTLRFGLNIDVMDVGADMALATLSIYLTLMIEKLRAISRQPTLHSAQSLQNEFLDLVVMFISSLVFGFFWLLTLVVLSKACMLGTYIAGFIAFGIGIAVLLAGSRLFYQILIKEVATPSDG